MASILLLLQLVIAFYTAFNLPFIIIRTYYFLTNTEKQEYPPSNKKFSENQDSYMAVLFLPTYIFEYFLQLLSALSFIMPLVVFSVSSALLFFFGKEIVTLGNALNWNWLDWLIFVPSFLFISFIFYATLSTVNEKIKEEEADPSGLFE